MAALVAAISVREAYTLPIETAGESSPLAASALTKNGRAERALRPAMTPRAAILAKPSQREGRSARYGFIASVSAF